MRKASWALTKSVKEKLQGILINLMNSFDRTSIDPTDIEHFGVVLLQDFRLSSLGEIYKANLCFGNPPTKPPGNLVGQAVIGANPKVYVRAYLCNKGSVGHEIQFYLTEAK